MAQANISDQPQALSNTEEPSSLVGDSAISRNTHDEQLVEVNGEKASQSTTTLVASSAEDAASTVSSETEGPDSHSLISSSGETGGPDSEGDISDNDDGVISHDESRRGMVIRQGDVVSFVADNLNEQIKLSSPSQSGASRSSRRSSLASDACSSTVDNSSISHKTLNDIEGHAKNLAQSIDKMLSDLQTNLHNMSAITVGCMQTYRGSVEKTLDEVDSNIKLMYTFMAKCEELNGRMKDIYPVADEINDIKRILDMFENDLLLNAPT